MLGEIHPCRCCCPGVDIVRKALRIPCYTIAANAGVDAQEVVTKVMQEKEEVGYDAYHDQYVDMLKTGIIDPTKVHTHLSRYSSYKYVFWYV